MGFSWSAELTMIPRVCSQNDPVCAFKTSPRVPAPRVHVSTHVRVVPVHTGTFPMYTRRRVELFTHGGFFSVPHHTPQHIITHTTPHTQTHTTTQNDTHHITRRQRQRKKTEKKRIEKEDREDKTRQDKIKEKMKEKKTEIMVWTDAESKFAQEKAKLDRKMRES